MRRLAALLALLALLAAPAGALALSVNEVAREVRCPTCNTPLDVSNAPVAQDMKAYIAARIEDGWDKERIIDGLVQEFGRGVLATPPKSGFDLVAWVVPALFVALGLAAVPILTRAWARRRGPAPAEPDLSDEDRRRLERELEQFPE